MKRIAPLLLIALAGAQDKPEPKISLEQQARWLQARAEFAEARIAYTEAQGRYETIVKELQAVCPIELKAGRPECSTTKETK